MYVQLKILLVLFIHTSYYPENVVCIFTVNRSHAEALLVVWKLPKIMTEFPHLKPQEKYSPDDSYLGVSEELGLWFVDE